MIPASAAANLAERILEITLIIDHIAARNWPEISS
jgi:hypothetical protein